MLRDKGIPTTEIFLDKGEFDAIDSRQLSVRFIEDLRSLVGIPIQGGYIADEHLLQVKNNSFWAIRHKPKPVFDFLDPELADACRVLFEAKPLAAVSEAFQGSRGSTAHTCWQRPQYCRGPLWGEAVK